MPTRKAAAARASFAKGQGRVAQTIIERAKEAGVFVHESPELVSLLMQVDLDQQIPSQLYRAVAELLAFIYLLEQGREIVEPDLAALLASTKTGGYMRRNWLIWMALVLAACSSAPQKTARLPAKPAVMLSRLQADGAAREVVMVALGLLDVGYQFGGANPEAGLDCSGMVRFIYQQALGVSLPPQCGGNRQACTSGWARRAAGGRSGLFRHASNGLFACRHLSGRQQVYPCAIEP